MPALHLVTHIMQVDGVFTQTVATAGRRARGAFEERSAARGAWKSIPSR